MQRIQNINSPLVFIASAHGEEGTTTPRLRAMLGEMKTPLRLAKLNQFALEAASRNRPELAKVRQCDDAKKGGEHHKSAVVAVHKGCNSAKRSSKSTPLPKTHDRFIALLPPALLLLAFTQSPEF